VRQAAGIAYREAGDAGAPPVLLVHGYPETSYMWRHAMAALADAGWRAVAPDLPGYGDSPPGDRPGTWEEHVESLERFRSALDLDGCVLVVHDWGVMIGLRWACDHPGAARGLVISDGGFFADRRWHDLANVMRTPGEGEQLVDENEGRLAALGVPFLALWGETDAFAPVGGAHRFAKEIPGARVQVIEGTGHFVFDDAPEEAAEALAAFVSEAAPR
jgi:haloalkane dehalogenase